MTEVQIPVSRREREGLIAGTVWCLVRSRAYGGPGDAFRVGDTWFAIIDTELWPWTRIRDEYFRECGFDSPREFQERYRADISGGRTFNPSLHKVVHWIEKIRYSGEKPILERPLIWNDPERIGMDARWITTFTPPTSEYPPVTLLRSSGDRPLIWNDPERIGMDALDYCMGVQCPLRDRCKRHVIEAMRYPNQIKVKILPTTPYDKEEGDCDYFIRK